MEPPVSVPDPQGGIGHGGDRHPRSPLEEPEGVRSGSWGFRMGRSEMELITAPPANSLMFTLASTMAPASRSFRTMKASSGGMDPARRREPAVVGRSAVSMLSLRKKPPGNAPVEGGNGGPCSPALHIQPPGPIPGHPGSARVPHSASAPHGRMTSIRASDSSTSRSAVSVPRIHGRPQLCHPWPPPAPAGRGVRGLLPLERPGSPETRRGRGHGGVPEGVGRGRRGGPWGGSLGSNGGSGLLCLRIGGPRGERPAEPMLPVPTPSPSG